MVNDFSPERMVMVMSDLQDGILAVYVVCVGVCVHG